jgi:protein O-mannosyl-transferase
MISERQTFSHLSMVALLALIGVCVYANSFSGPFVFDDFRGVVQDSKGSLSEAKNTWNQIATSKRPLVSASFTAQYALHGPRVFGYHVVNVLIHLLTTLCFWGFLRRTLLTHRMVDRHGAVAARLAFVVALIWMVHPIQTQSVNYLSQRAELFSALFYVLVLYCVVRGSQLSNARAWYFLAVLSCALGMLSKATIITAPILVLIYDRIFLSQSISEMFKKRWGLYLGLALSYFFLMRTINPLLGDPLTMENLFLGPELKESVIGFDVRGITPFEYARTQPGVLVHYLKLSLFPLSLCFDYAWPVAETLQNILPGTVIIGALLFATGIALFRWPSLGFLGAWFFLILAPRSSFVAARDLAVEHRMYLPLAAVVALIVFSLHAGFQTLRRRGSVPQILGSLLPVGLFILITAILSGLTWQRNFVYMTESKLWRDTVSKRPENYRAWNNLGEALFREGRYKESVEPFNEAIRLKPDYPEPYNNLGSFFADRGQFDRATSYFEKALELKPFYGNVYFNIGVMLQEQGKLDEALRHYEKALSFHSFHSNPALVQAYNNVGTIFAERGQIDRALPYFEQAFKLSLGDPVINANLQRALELMQPAK